MVVHTKKKRPRQLTKASTSVLSKEHDSVITSKPSFVTDMTSCVVDTPFLVKVYKRQTGVVENTIKESEQREQNRLHLLNRCNDRIEREKLAARFEMEREKDIQLIKNVNEDRDILVNAFAAKARGDLLTYRVDRNDYSEDLATLKGDIGPFKAKSREFEWDTRKLSLRENFWEKLEDPNYGKPAKVIGRKNPTYMAPKSDPAYDPYVELLMERKSILTSMKNIVNEEESLLKTWQGSYNNNNGYNNSKKINSNRSRTSDIRTTPGKVNQSPLGRALPRNNFNSLNTARTTSTLASMATFISEKSCNNRPIAKISSTHRQYSGSDAPCNTQRSSMSKSSSDSRIQVPKIW